MKDIFSNQDLEETINIYREQNGQEEPLAMLEEISILLRRQIQLLEELVAK